MERLQDVSRIAAFFLGWDETMIWSCLQGVMGEAYADSAENPQSAMICVNCFAFAAGKPDESLVRGWYSRQTAPYSVITARDTGWDPVFEAVGKAHTRRVERYAFKKEPDVFDTDTLNRLVSRLSDQYTLKLIDEDIYHLCRKTGWSADFVQGYADYGMFHRYGLGVVAFHGEELVSGASSFSGYSGGIEVEIDTKPEYRRQGLAAACAARLILECIRRGLYPSWDAQNQWSLHLAEKLGYHYSHAYPAYEFWK